MIGTLEKREMKHLIQEGKSLTNIEKSIIAEIKGKELWGDIALSENEYEILKARIRTLLENKAVDIRYICDHYPCSLTTFLIFLVRYEYNVNFWGLIGQELNIPINNSAETEMGQCARNMFRKYGFDFSDVKDERRVNLEPILYEAGRPPESSLDDLFYVLKYDTYSVFDPQLIIEDLVAMRSYRIRMPMLRFFKRFRGDRAVEFVLEVHDAMLAVDQNMSGESQYIGNYSEWKEKEKTKEAASHRKKQEYQAKPYLVFENGKRGLCLVLPRTIMKDEWLDDVEWVIIADNKEQICKRMSVFGDEGKRYVESITVPICPARNYRITLYDLDGVKDDVIVDWSIDGIRDDSIVFFNSNGRMITPNYLPFPYGIMIYSESVKILKYTNTTLNYQYYPTDRKGYSIVSIEPTGRDAAVSYFINGSSVTLNTRPQIDMSFHGKTLFSLPQDGKSHLFTDIPELIIAVDEGTITNGFEVRIAKLDVDISNAFSEGKASLNLKKYKQKVFSQFGTYSIRLYQYDHFLKQIEFSYVPKIKTDYSPILNWPKQLLRKEKKIYRFQRIDNWELEFPDCVVTSDETNYKVECPTNVGTVTCILKSTAEDEGFACSIKLPVNPFAIDILDSQGMIQGESTDKLVRLGLSELNKSQYWVGIECFGEYKDYPYKLKLRTVNGIEQEESISLSQTGCVNFNLMSFLDTLNSCPLPARIELWCGDDEDKTIAIIVVTDTLEMAERPAYTSKGYIVLSIKDDKKDLTVRRFGPDPFEMVLPYSSSVLDKSRKIRIYRCARPLEEGLYVIEGERQKYDFVFEDDFGVELTSGKNTMYVSTRPKGARIITFSDWLDLLIREVVKAGSNKDIQTGISYSMLSRVKDLEKATFNKYDYERIIALAFFINAKCADAKKNSIKKCMQEISRRILDGQSRLELIRLLARLNCSQEIFDICVQEYSLLLFKRGSEDSKFLAEQLESKSTELALLFHMGINDSVWNTIRRDKYRDIIGKEAIRCMLDVPNEEDPAVIAIEQKKFLREYSPCRVRIKLTKEISGDFEPLMAMLDITWKSVTFNISKKPDYGIYFDRIRYVDQYVNWYTANHDKNGSMVSWKVDMMKAAVKSECSNILKSIDELERKASLGKMLKRYNAALRSRFQGDLMANMNSNNYARYFYLQGLAAFLVMLPSEYRKYGWAVRSGEQFMLDAMIIAPRMAKRDLIMASTFIYLVGKEEKICL